MAKHLKRPETGDVFNMAIEAGSVAAHFPIVDADTRDVFARTTAFPTTAEGKAELIALFTVWVNAIPDSDDRVTADFPPPRPEEEPPPRGRSE